MDTSPRLLAIVFGLLAGSRIYAATTLGRPQLAVAGILLGLVAALLWSSEPRVLGVLAVTSWTCCAPYQLLIEGSGFGYLHYEHRWEPDGVERFQRTIMLQVATYLALGLLIGLAAYRGYRRKPARE